MRTWLDAGKLIKTTSQGKGFAVRRTADLPFILEQGMEVSFAPPLLDMPRSAKVLSADPVDSQTQNVVFDLRLPESRMMDMVGMHCLVLRACAPAQRYADPGNLLAGFRVADARLGYLGTVAQTLSNGAQTILAVQTEDPRFDATVYIPYVEELVSDVDSAAGEISVCVPDSLLTLNGTPQCG